jgi:hypothetical protein
MIDLEALARCQAAGIKLMNTLTDDEKGKIDTLCEFACQQIIQAAVNNKEPLQKAVNDAFLYGIGLGLKLQVQSGELKER